MSKKPAKRHIKKMSTSKKAPNSQAGTATRSTRPGVMTVDPSIEREVQKVFTGYLIHMAITLLITMLVALLIVHIAKMEKSIGPGVVFMSVMLGLLFTYRRGVAQVFKEVRKLGSNRLSQRRYADAVFALEHFHRMGNMGFDKDGGAHYDLMLAYQGMGQKERAADMATWLTKYRARSPYTAKLAAAATLVPDPSLDQESPRVGDVVNTEDSEAPKQ